MFSPAPTTLHLGSFLFVLTVTGVSVLLFLRQVPVADLLVGDGNRAGYRRIERVNRWLQVVVSVAGLLMLPALALDATTPPAQIESMLGSGLYSSIQLVTTASALRVFFALITVLTLGWIGVDSLLRQYSEWSEPGGLQWFGPAAAGGLLTVVAAGTARRVFDRMLTETTAQLPASLALEVENRVLPIVSVYGETAVVILLAGVLVAFAGWIGLGSWLAVYFGYLTNEGGGFAIASGGLFFAAIGAVIQGAPEWVAFGVITASLVVWDIGTFGAQLGREVGAGETRGVELVHASATLAVGIGSTLVAFLLLSVAPETVSPSPTATLTLVCLGAGFVAFSLALRDSIRGQG
jgi:hypothetical protein